MKSVIKTVPVMFQLLSPSDLHRPNNQVVSDDLETVLDKVLHVLVYTKRRLNQCWSLY